MDGCISDKFQTIGNRPSVSEESGAIVRALIVLIVGGRRRRWVAAEAAERNGIGGVGQASRS